MAPLALAAASGPILRREALARVPRVEVGAKGGMLAWNASTTNASAAASWAASTAGRSFRRAHLPSVEAARSAATTSSAASSRLVLRRHPHHCCRHPQDHRRAYRRCRLGHRPRRRHLRRHRPHRRCRPSRHPTRRQTLRCHHRRPCLMCHHPRPRRIHRPNSPRVCRLRTCNFTATASCPNTCREELSGPSLAHALSLCHPPCGWPRCSST